MLFEQVSGAVFSTFTTQPDGSGSKLLANLAFLWGSSDQINWLLYFVHSVNYHLNYQAENAKIVNILYTGEIVLMAEPELGLNLPVFFVLQQLLNHYMQKISINDSLWRKCA